VGRRGARQAARAAARHSQSATVHTDFGKNKKIKKSSGFGRDLVGRDALDAARLGLLSRLFSKLFSNSPSRAASKAGCVQA